VPLAVERRKAKMGRRPRASRTARTAVAVASHGAPSSPTEIALARVWADALGDVRLTRSDNFFDLGGDSLAAIRTVQRIREVLQCELPLRTFFEAANLAALAQSIDRPDERATADSLAAELDADATLPADIVPSSTTRTAASRRRKILLTGATGFLGAYLLRELLAHDDTVVHCLVRARSDAEAMRRLRTNLERYGLWHASLASRIKPVRGDLAESRLGLSAEQFATLSRTIHVIYHNAAHVDLSLPYPQLKPTSVSGTTEVLRLACTGRAKSVHYVSTISVFPMLVDGGPAIIGETLALPPADSLVGGYARSKWVAERLVRECGLRGLPVTIYRPGMVASDSRGNDWSRDGFVARFVGGCARLGSMPDVDARLDLTPVDYVARSIVALSRRRSSVGQTFHLVNPRPAPLAKVAAWLRDRGHTVVTEHYDQWRARLTNIVVEDPSNPLGPLLPLLPDAASSPGGGPPAIAAFDCRQTAAGLRGTRIVCPPVDAQLLDRCFPDQLAANASEISPARTVA